MLRALAHHRRDEHARAIRTSATAGIFATTVDIDHHGRRNDCNSTLSQPWPVPALPRVVEAGQLRAQGVLPGGAVRWHRAEQQFQQAFRSHQ